MKKIFSLVCLLLSMTIADSQTRYPIVPYPNKLVEREGDFQFKSQLLVSFPVVFKSEFETLKSLFQEEFIQLIPSGKAKVVVKKNTY